MEEIDKFEGKKKEYEWIDNRYNRAWLWSINILLYDLNIEKGLELERIKEIEIKLEKIKLSITIADATEKSVISEKCLHHISRHRRRTVNNITFILIKNPNIV